jgi:UDP-N-acetyl-2-amino-2-deoxyglucuronate dehydrogenase
MSIVLSIGIVGLGNIGKRHLDILFNMPTYQLIAICDVDAEKLNHFSEIYGVPGFLKYEEFLNYCSGAGCSIIGVTTPHHEHATQTIKALEKGFDVLVEKPMAIHSSDALNMIQVAQSANRRLWVVKQNRYNAPVAKVNELIMSGQLGKIYHLQCQIIWNRNEAYYLNSSWRGKLDKEGGALYTHASHFIDLMTWWAGKVIHSEGLMKRIVQPIESEDLGSAVIEFDSGAMGSITWTTLSHGQNQEGSITIISERGTIKIGGPYLNKIDYWDVSGILEPIALSQVDKPNDYGSFKGSSSNHHLVYESIWNENHSGVIQTVDGVEGLKSIEAIETIYRSIGKIDE